MNDDWEPYRHANRVAAPIPLREFIDRTRELIEPACAEPRGPAPGWENGRQATSSPRSFELIPFDKVQLGSAPAYLVRGVLPRTGLAVVWGPPKCGKSFFVFDLVMHVALGWRFRGLRTIQGAVVYAALEGKQGFTARIHAFRERRLSETADSVPFYFCPATLNLIADHGAFADVIAAGMGETSPAVIVIDTVNRSLAGSESDDRDMAAYIGAADSLAKRFECLTLLVHHSGVDASRPRGHTSLAGAVDAQIAVKKDAAGQIAATVELSKDFESGQTFLSRLESVEVGIDDEGEAITSCVVEAVDGEPVAPREKKKRTAPLSRPAAAILAAFEEIIGSQGQNVSVLGDGPSVRALKLSSVRSEFRRRYAVGEIDEKKVSATVRQAFGRALDQCDAAGLKTGAWASEEWIWRL